VLIYCECSVCGAGNTPLGGFASFGFDVTDTGIADNTTSIIKSSLSMVLVYVFVILFFAVIGYVNFRFNQLDMGKFPFWLMITSWSFALINLLALLWNLYLFEMNIDLSTILRINAITTSLALFGIGMVTMLLIVNRLISLDDTDEKWNKPKW